VVAYPLTTTYWGEYMTVITSLSVVKDLISSVFATFFDAQTDPTSRGKKMSAGDAIGEHFGT
jgi:hypothetical protein